jgi:hypothetical protein
MSSASDVHPDTGHTSGWASMSSVTSFGAFVKKTPSAALCHSSMVVKWGKDSLLLMPPHKELSELVKLGLRGGDVNPLAPEFSFKF